MLLGPNHPLNRPAKVGKAKPSNRDLPSPSHIYGYKPPPQIEGVKEVVHKPVLETEKKNEYHAKDFTKINTFVKGEMSTLPDGSQVLSKPDIRVVKKTGQKTMDIYLPEEKFAYGVPTKAKANFKKIMTNHYGNTA